MESAAYDEIRRRIEERVAELAPLIAERDRLRSVLDAFDDALGGERPARERVPQLAALVAQRPGIRQRDAARELGLDRTAVYPVVRRAVAQGRIVKRDGALHPAGGADDANGATATSGAGRSDGRAIQDSDDATGGAA